MTERGLVHSYFAIEIDDEPLGVADIVHIDNIKIVDHKEGMDQASFDVGDAEYQYQTLFISGKRVKLVLGYLDGLTYTFVGEIVGAKVTFGTDGIPIIKVKCDNNAKRMTESQEHRQWVGMKRSDMVEEIAGKYGLETFVVDTGTVVEFETQAGITDAAFVVRLAAKENYIFKVRGSALYFGPEGETRTAQRRLQYRIGEHSIASADLGFKTEDEARGVVGAQVDEREATTTEVAADAAPGVAAPGAAAPGAEYGQRSWQGDYAATDLAQAEGEGAADDDGVNFGEFESMSTRD